MYPEGFDPKNLVTGLNSSRRAVKGNIAQRVFLGNDASSAIIFEMKCLASEHGVPIDETCTMAQLGVICGIDVSCAVCAILKSDT